MNLFTVLLPYLILIGAIFLLEPIIRISRKLARISKSAFFLRVHRGAERQRIARNGNPPQNFMETVISLFVFGLFLFVFFVMILMVNQLIIKSNPTSNYQIFIPKAEIVLAFGFGIEENEIFLAGISNDLIMNWVKCNTNAKYIIAQKGCAISEFKSNKTQIIEMHPHNKNTYINTYQAAIYALNKLDSLKFEGNLNNNEVIVVTHDCQLERVAWILNKISEKKSYHFIVPEIRAIPFPSKSSQIHTRNRFIYTIVELYISRPRDYFKVIFNL